MWFNSKSKIRVSILSLSFNAIKLSNSEIMVLTYTLKFQPPQDLGRVGYVLFFESNNESDEFQLFSS